MGQQGDYGQWQPEQPRQRPGHGPGYTRAAGFGPQDRNPRTRPPATPPQFQPGTPPRQDPRPAMRHAPRQDPGPAFTPGYQSQPQPPRGHYPPQQPTWQQPYQPPQCAPRPPRQHRPHTARNVLAALGGIIVLVIVISVAASGGHTVQTAGSTAGTAAQGGRAKTAGTGSAITLAGNSSGEQMSVTVTKVISDAQPGDEFTSAPAGDRLYAVQFRLTDAGSAAYSDAPSNGAAVTDSSGQSYQSALAATAAGCTSFPATENIAPGSSGLGCIVFEVPASAKITQVQFTLDSGMGPQTGQWNVG